MKKLKITYGVNGFMEFQAVLKIGKTNLKVQFSDGSFNASSRKPATFTTDDLMVQHAIENSDEYKRGLIHKVNVVELNEEVKVLRNGPKSQPEPTHNEIEVNEDKEPANETADSCSASDMSTTASEAPEDDMPAGETLEAAMEEIPVAVAVEPASETTNPASELLKVEVTCNDDARDYLEEHYGVTRSKLRTRTIIEELGASYGIEFVFVKA